MFHKESVAGWCSQRYFLTNYDFHVIKLLYQIRLFKTSEKADG